MRDNAQATDVRIAFGIEWVSDSLISGHIGVEWSVEAENLKEPLKGQVLALAQKAAEQVEPPEEAQP